MVTKISNCLGFEQKVDIGATFGFICGRTLHGVRSDSKDF